MSVASAAGSGLDITDIIGDLVSTISGVTGTLGSVGGSSTGLGGATAIVTVVINIVVVRPIFLSETAPLMSYYSLLPVF